MLSKVFAETDYVAPEFVPVALDLCKYEFDDLVEEAMFLLMRYHSSFEDVFDYAMQAQVHSTGMHNCIMKPEDARKKS